jgi:uncharacterized membrane protein
MTFLNFFYFFIFYSFLGWLVETLSCSIEQGHFVDRGFLDGPFCPIYGFGALAIILFVFPFHQHIFLFFITSIIVASIIEYFTSLFFEKLFKVTWWDYSNKPFNLQGRICLENSIYWGILSILVLTFIHPSIINLTNFLSNHLGLVGIIIFMIYFIIDATNTFHVLLEFKQIISKKISQNIHLHKKIARLTKSFPNFKPKINNNIINELKAKIKKLSQS